MVIYFSFFRSVSYCTKQGLGHDLEFCNLYILAPLVQDRVAKCIFFLENNTIILTTLNTAL